MTTTWGPVQIADAELLRFSNEDITDNARLFARLFGDALRRRQATLICERDGHVLDERYGFYCTRCTETIHPERMPTS